MRAVEIALLILWFNFCGLCLTVELRNLQSSDTNSCRGGEESRLGHVYSREELLALRPEPKTTTARHDYTPVLNNIPAELIRKRRRKRGKKGGKENRLRRRSTRPPLPSIVLANVRAIHNKIGTIRTYARYSHDYREASLLCFTETWLKPSKLDSLYEVPGFTLVRLDRGGGGGYGGVCAYINDRWCRAFTIKTRICDDPNVEILGMTLRPFYLPREFGCILLFVVYVPPNGPGKAAQAAKTIADCVHELQLQYPDAPAIVLGDLNQCYLDTVLPGFEQYVKDATRKNNISDKCYVNIPNAYVAKVGPPILISDHNAVCLTPV